MMMDQQNISMQDPSSPFPLNTTSCPPLTEWMSPHVACYYPYVNGTSSAETSCGHARMTDLQQDTQAPCQLHLPVTGECQQSLVNLADPYVNISENVYISGHAHQDFLSASQSDMLPAYNDACRQDAWGQHVWREGDETCHNGTTPGDLTPAGHPTTSAGGLSCDRPSYGQVVLMPCGLDDGARLSYAGVAMLGPPSSLPADVQQNATDVVAQDLQTDQTFSYLPARQAFSQMPEEHPRESSDEELAGFSAAMVLNGDISGSTRREEESRKLEEAAGGEEADGGPIVIVCARKGSLTGKNKVEISYETLSSHFDQSMQEASKKLGIGKSTLKVVCRRLGLEKWPYKHVGRRRRRSTMVHPPPVDFDLSDIELDEPGDQPPSRDEL
mmetsp:Transcript_27790/g.90408  ORF Transcript_27790/g.90408 Transcript_27790/m.90408 type:complete len:385 (-) Transcript_27790:67-1221(-)